MIQGNGIDIVKVDRIKKAIEENSRFLERLFSKNELKYIYSKNENKNTVAGMFAAKEAVSKVLGTGISNFKWKNIEILHDELNKPYVNLTGVARDIAIRKRIDNIHISISHDSGITIAFAIGEGGMSNKIVDNNIKIKRSSADYQIIDRQLVKDIIPVRKKESHKGTYGRVGIIAGSIGMTGAACLTASAALRSGSGLVYSFVPRSLNNIFEIKLTEVITKPVEDLGKGHFTEESVTDVLKEIENIQYFAIGPGLGVDLERVRFIKEMLNNIHKPIVLDGDGLNCCVENTEILSNRGIVTIITPHPGELSRLIGKSVDEIQNNRIKYAKITSQKFGVITVLKGANTVVCSPKGEVFVNTTGNPGMATAGSGDLLTGIITSFMGQGIKPLEAAAAGVYIHGLAGDLAASKKGQYGIIASDILEHIPYAIQELFK